MAITPSLIYRLEILSPSVSTKQEKLIVTTWRWKLFQLADLLKCTTVRVMRQMLYCSDQFSYQRVDRTIDSSVLFEI